MQHNNNLYAAYTHSSQQTPNVASAPPLDEDNHNHMHQNHQNDIHFQQPCPPMYPYPYGPYMIPHIPIPIISVEQYNEQNQMRKNQEQDNCCCIGLMALLCCCLY
jgi:hypothetical protein